MQGNEPAFFIHQHFLLADDDSVVDGSSQDWKAPGITGATWPQSTQRQEPRGDLRCRWLRHQMEEARTNYRVMESSAVSTPHLVADTKKPTTGAGRVMGEFNSNPASRYVQCCGKLKDNRYASTPQS